MSHCYVTIEMDASILPYNSSKGSEDSITNGEHHIYAFPTSLWILITLLVDCGTYLVACKSSIPVINFSNLFTESSGSEWLLFSDIAMLYMTCSILEMKLVVLIP